MKVMILAVVSVAALAACEQPSQSEHSYGNDALPSAEVTAFTQTDARLGYKGATIEWDNRNCALYQGTDQGRVKQVPLIGADGKQICART